MHTKTDLEYLGVYDLRNHARSLGVKRPTQKSKEQLINEILQAQTVSTVLYVKSNRGRPPNLSINAFGEALSSEILKEKHRILNCKFNKLLHLVKEISALMETNNIP